MSKGNKERNISVSKAMLKALTRYRQSRDLIPDLATPGETTPLITKHNSYQPPCSDRMVRKIIQLYCALVTPY